MQLWPDDAIASHTVTASCLGRKLPPAISQNCSREMGDLPEAKEAQGQALADWPHGLCSELDVVTAIAALEMRCINSADVELGLASEPPSRRFVDSSAAQCRMGGCRQDMTPN